MQASLYERVPVPPSAEKAALVAFGSNLASPGVTLQSTLLSARDRLVQAGLPLIAMSPLYRTPAYPPGSGPDYANAVGAFSVGGHIVMRSLLAMLHAVEREFRRVRSQRWASRTLDLDLLAVGDLVLPDAETQDRWRALPPERQRTEAPDQLILPHPRLQDRAFVLVPMADVAPDWRHPRLGLTVRQMLEALPKADRDAVVPL
jgi:2-amino-4-hydroxy-6-hydroxymethyldihydropteridine diphosphokinase